MVSRQRTAGYGGAAGVSVIAGHDQLIVTGFDNFAPAGHVVIQRALAQRKRCAFCNRHIASTERGGVFGGQNAAVNFSVAVVVASVAEDQRAVALFG